MFWSKKHKEKKVKYEDDSYDGEFNFDDGDDDPFGAVVASRKKSGREVVTDAGAQTLRAIPNKILAPASIVQMTKRALPKEYRQAFNAYDSTISETRGLYDSAVKEAKPLIKVLKKTVGKVTPAIDTVLPKAMAEKIKNWSIDNEQTTRMPSKEEQRAMSMNSELAEFMQHQIKTDASQRAEDTGKEVVRNTIENMRHKDVVGNLSEIILYTSSI